MSKWSSGRLFRGRTCFYCLARLLNRTLLTFEGLDTQVAKAIADGQAKGAQTNPEERDKVHRVRTYPVASG
jgi:hypothetical protein